MISKKVILNSLFARTLVCAALVSTVIAVFWFSDATIGYSAETTVKFTRVSAGTGPLLIAFALLFATIYCVIVNSRPEIKDLRSAPMWPRVVAFAIDFLVVIFSLGSLLGFIPIVLEALRTGTFQWHFERNYQTSSDRVGAVLVFVGLVFLACYFILPLLKGTQTIGCWIFRLATANNDGYVVRLPLTTAVRRLYWEFRGLSSPIKTFRTRDGQGRTFYDRESEFTVMRY